MPGRGNRYGGKHLAWRRAILTRDPLCVMCDRQGITTVATVADHIVPIEAGGPQYDMSNGQGLCASCHNGAKQSYERTGKVRGCDVHGTPAGRAW